MEYTEVRIKIPTEKTETAENIANMVVPYGIYVEDYSDLEKESWEIAHIDLIDEELLEKDRTSSIIHIYFNEDMNVKESVAFLTERFNSEGIPFSFDTDSVNDADWKDNWKKFFKTTKIGKNLVIRPSWEEYDNIAGRKVLSIDPGAAFGTGTHATTKMCLEMVEKYTKTGDKVLDIGCGSGILGIAAALLGAEKVDGVDIDPVAVKVANENACINNVENIAKFTVGDLAEKITGKYNIVCANIIADVIIYLSANVFDYMEEGALFLCSGIIDIRQNDVLDALDANGFKIVEECKCDNWCAYACKR